MRKKIVFLAIACVSFALTGMDSIQEYNNKSNDAECLSRPLTQSLNSPLLKKARCECRLPNKYLDSCLQLVKCNQGFKEAVGSIRELAAFSRKWAKILHCPVMTGQIINHIYLHDEKKRNPHQDYFDLFIHLSSVGAIRYMRNYLNAMDPSDKDYKDICSKLLYYSAQNSYDDVWACLNMRIDPNFIYSKDIYDTYDEIYKRPALIHGLIHEDYDLTDLLLSFSADPNSIDPLSKKSALIIAILRNNHYLIQLLLSYGANVNMQGNRHGNTPLMVVARKIGQAIQENNDSEIKKAVRCLQEICAYQPDFSLKNNCGKTVWDIAQRYNTTEDMVHYINNASAGRFC